MSTNWELCFFFCQKTKRKDVIRRAPISFENLTDRRKRFIQLDLIVDLSRIDEGTGIIQTLASNNAFYHKGCYYNLNDNHYERLVKKVQKQSAEGSPYSTQTIPHKQKKLISKKQCVCFATTRITMISSLLQVNITQEVITQIRIIWSHWRETRTKRQRHYVS